MDAIYIGRKLLTNEIVLRAMYYTSQNFFHLFSNLKLETSKNDSDSIMSELNAFDIENYISIVESFLVCIDLDRATQPVQMSIYNVKRTVSEMYHELDTIYRKIKYNNSLWMMSSIRAYDCTEHIRNLKRQKQKLEERFELLMKLTKLFPKCVIDEKPNFDKNVKWLIQP